MLLEVKGKRYRTDLNATMQLRTMRSIKRDFGVGWASVLTYINGLDSEQLIGDLLGDVEFQAWIAAWVRNAGDELSVEELGALTAGDVQLVPNESVVVDDDEAGDGDEAPTSAPTGSARGDVEHTAAPAAKAASTRGAGSSKTSRKRSTSGSSTSRTGGRGSRR